MANSQQATKAKCKENQALVNHMKKWWTDMSVSDNYTDKLELAIKKAFSSVRYHKFPIKTKNDLRNVRNIGKWFFSQLEDFFDRNSHAPVEDGKKGKGGRAYLPRINSAPFAMLIILYRRKQSGIESMGKQELIDAADASGLSQAPIAPQKGKGKPGKAGSSAKELYCGWSSMKTLIEKGLVEKTGSPAKYKLSEEGCKKAHECLLKSGMLGAPSNTVSTVKSLDVGGQGINCLDLDSDDSVEEVTSLSTKSKPKKRMNHYIHVDDSNLVSGDEVVSTFVKLNMKKRCNDEVPLENLDLIRAVPARVTFTSGNLHQKKRVTADIPVECLQKDSRLEKPSQLEFQACQSALRLPPLEYPKKFEDEYEVVLILDKREHFVRSKSRNLVPDVSSNFEIQIEDKQLPVGDAIWIARHKREKTEYVLDIIVERKNVDDLWSSIRDNRYKDQKFRIMRTGLRKMIYVVEGDPSVCEGADSIKTACLTTEIMEGFDVKRTKGLGDTLQLYGQLTLAINDYCKSSSKECRSRSSCPLYSEFIKKCEDHDNMTVSDVFGVQLMQIPRVTEEVALAVLHCFPTLHSLFSTYALLDGDTRAQEELLMRKSNKVIGLAVSRNIFRFVWT